MLFVHQRRSLEDKSTNRRFMGWRVEARDCVSVEKQSFITPQTLSICLESHDANIL